MPPSPVPLETEVKLAMPSADTARGAVARTGAALVQPRHFEDNLLFDHPGLGLARTGRALRLRRVEGAGRLTYKGPRRDHDGVKSRPELETALPDPDGLQAILEVLGFRASFRYQKYRETYRGDATEITVDETPLGVFVEIEGSSAEAIHRAASALGCGPGDYVRDSYAGLWRAAGHDGDMVF